MNTPAENWSLIGVPTKTRIAFRAFMRCNPQYRCVEVRQVETKVHSVLSVTLWETEKDPERHNLLVIKIPVT